MSHGLWRCGVAVAILGWGASTGGAQEPARPGSAVRGTAAALTASPGGNPYLNPVFNPGLLQEPAGRDALWLYLLKANDANGGIGSGRISGVRAAEEGAHTAGYPPQISRPAAGASRYFNRAPARPAPRPLGAGRQVRHFRQNGR
jgi:hypothetical protein